MLIINAPIALKCRTPFVDSKEMFVRRITDTYSMMNEKLESQDLFHAVNEPPEVFIEENPGTSMVVNNLNLNENRSEKLEIINNLVNKISASVDVGLTYKDKVYISNYLHKLGVTNETKFMSDFKKYVEEQKNTQKLIDIYWNNMEGIRQIVNEYREERTTLEESDTTVNAEYPLYLQDEIFNRLQTGAVYKTLQNFYEKQYGETYVSSQEMFIAEQARTSDNILLNMLKQTVDLSSHPLTFVHENAYETIDSEYVENEEAVTKNISSAILMDMVQKLYNIRYNNNRRTDGSVYEITESFYKSGDNTVNRIKENVEGDRFAIDQRHYTSFTDMSNNEKKNEITLLYRLFEESDTSEFFEGIENIENLTRNFNDSYLALLYERTIKNLSVDNSVKVDRRRKKSEQKNITENDLRKTYLKSEIQKIDVLNREDATYPQNIENFTEENVNYLNVDASVEETEENVQNVSEETRIQTTTERIQNELKRIENRNEENRIRYENALREISRENREVRTADVERITLKESLKTLEHPERIIDLIESGREEKEYEKEERRKEAIRRAIPEEKQRVYEIVSEILDNPGKAAEEGRITINNQTQLNADLFYANRELQNITENIESNVTQEIQNNVIEETVRRHEQSVKRISEEIQKIEFKHKVSENTIDEEFLEELRQQRKEERVTKKETESVNVNNVRVNETKVNNVEKNITNIDERQIEEMIDRGVRQQMGSITERVYNKLERRLDNEKKRRGY